MESQRQKANFCYFTGTNRTGQEQAIIATMLKSMRSAGVLEDLHVFSPVSVDGAINHPIADNLSWDNHMAKFGFLRELAGTDYEYCVWLDSDNYFTRDPGDLKPMIRDNPLWVAMESDATSPKVRWKDWWTVPYPKLVELFRAEGVTSDAVWNSNGGMWIVRTEDINRVADKLFEIYERFKEAGFPNIADEVVLACLGAMWVDDPYLNTTDRTDAVWACDWVGRYAGRIPDGHPWLYEDWLTGESRMINPAIVHAMRSKQAMAAGKNISTATPLASVPMQSKEPVGTKLAEIFRECGVKPPANCSCTAWINKMNAWGLDGCRVHRDEILNHLTHASKQVGWLSMAKVAVKGYLSTEAILNEAIRRAEPQLSVA